MFTVVKDVFELIDVLPVTNNELNRIKTRNNRWVDFVFIKRIIFTKTRSMD